MPPPSPSKKPSRSRSNGPARAAGIVVSGRHRRQEDEARETKRVDHAVRAPRENHVGRAPADDLDSLADRLGAGGAGRQARGVVAAGAEDTRQIAGWRARLLIGLAGRMQRFHAQAREQCLVDLASPGRAMNEIDEGREVLLPFARAEVDAKSSRVNCACHRQSRVLHGHRRGGKSELRGAAMVAPPLGVGAIIDRARSP